MGDERQPRRRRGRRRRMVVEHRTESWAGRRNGSLTATWWREVGADHRLMRLEAPSLRLE